MREILDEVKREKGYTADNDYQGSLALNGAAPSRNAYFDTKEERAEAFKNISTAYEADMGCMEVLYIKRSAVVNSWRLSVERLMMTRSRKFPKVMNRKMNMVAISQAMR